MLTRGNLFVGVVGAINSKDLEDLLEKTFGALPGKPGFNPVAEFEPTYDAKEHIVFDGPQTIVSIALPGMKRSDPEFFAAYLMNHILGGGTFSSRIYDEIREKRGLVYGVGTNVSPLDHSAYISGGFATKPDQAREALELLLSEIDRMAKNGPSDAELEAAKKYVIGSYAINNLDTSSKIANVLVGLQSSHLGIDYINTRAAKINGVTLEQAKQAAKKLLSVPPLIVTIGPGAV
jgi:zinc protease